MDRMDEELREMIAAASVSPSITRREELLDSLVSRIDAGGADVADAPTPAKLLEVVAAEPKSTTLPKPLVRAAGIGIGGWIAIAVGSAVAATVGAQLLDGADSLPVPSPAVTSTVPDLVRAADVPPVQALSPEEFAAALASDAGSTEDTDSISGADESDESAESGAGAAVDAGTPTVIAQGEDSPGITVGGDTPATAPNGSTPPASNSGSLGGVTGEVTDTVEDLLPEGPIKDTLVPVLDTVAPVVDSLNVEGVLAGLTGILGTLLCDTPGVSVTAHDNVGITSVSLRLTTATGFSKSIPLSKTGSNSWSGAIAPLSLTNLPVVNKVAKLTVEVSDAEGNTTTASTNVTATIGRCL
ncbi:hypothetical protein [Demequina aurantiaca]|uniref:hypothetical protein n=1 Tax=Demequina aurantiaca TaxID=676200 RepID=UPI003D32E472